MKNLNIKIRLLLFCGVFVAALSSCSDNTLTNEEDIELLTSNTLGSQFDYTFTNDDIISSLGSHKVSTPCDASLIDDVQANIVWSEDCVPSLVLTLCCDCPGINNTHKTGCTTPPNATFNITYVVFPEPTKYYTIDIPYTSISNGNCIEIRTEIVDYFPFPDPSIILGIAYNEGNNIAHAYSPGCNY